MIITANWWDTGDLRDERGEIGVELPEFHLVDNDATQETGNITAVENLEGRYWIEFWHIISVR